jgi:hypothetical protein
MRTRLLPLYLPADLYARLEEAARTQDREPIQQARHLLRQALDTSEQLHATQDETPFAESHARERSGACER